MVKRNNFLLGQGQRLTSNVTVVKGGKPKDMPYTFSDAQKRVSQKLATVNAHMRTLPDEACPQNEAVATVTLHPRYLSKTDFPTELLRAAGLRPIGSRPKKVLPDKWGTKTIPTEAVVTAEIFVAGPRTAFHQLDSKLHHWTEDNAQALQIVRIESMDPFGADDKIRYLPENRDVLVLEVVLQDGERPGILKAFCRYAQMIGAEVVEDRIDRVGSLIFAPVRVHRDRVHDLAMFAFVRVARGMPGIRPFDIKRGYGGFNVELPKEGPLDPELRVAVFDGGLPPHEPLQPWVDLHLPTSLGKLDPDSQSHGMGVTSALLFGPLTHGASLPRPFSKVDHYAVLDDKVGQHGDFEVLDVLNRITDVLDQHPGKYRFVNLSLGPDLVVDDGDVTLWTAKLDERMARYDIFATVAVGNCGHLDPDEGANRVQPPSDGVNVLAVGAADSQGVSWARADYSCIGPGRTPGRIKPDGLGFGGSYKELFYVLDDCQKMSVRMEMGTSFAAPAVLRTAVGVQACLGEDLNPLAIRALLIHRAVKGDHHHPYEVGHGRFEPDVSQLICCGDDEATIVYQGELPTGQTLLRAPIPMPPKPLTGKVQIKATLLISPDVDPAHPFTYTRDGIEATFRPHADKFNFDKDGNQSAHPKSKAFFSGHASSELEKRSGNKWEPCLNSSLTMLATSLFDPVFDINYHQREGGMTTKDVEKIPYALIVSVKAVKVPDLYTQIFRHYANILQPLTPVLELPLPAGPGPSASSV